MANENRKLASVQEIEKIEPIKKADRLEVATVLGWQVVVQKGQFEQGQKVIFFEIDSFLPIREEFEFLRDSSYKNNPLNGEGFRLKTIKLRGQISQGLIVPIGKYKDLPVGTDLTEELGIKVYQDAEYGDSSTGVTIKRFHPLINKTDEIRVQSEPKRIEALQGKPYYITEKVDGQSITISYTKEEGFRLFTRNVEIKREGNSPIWKYFENLGLPQAMETNDKDIYLQGELYGPGIQGNPLKKGKLDWLYFNLGTIDTENKSSDRVPYGEWDKFFEENKEIASFKDKHVKILEEGDSFAYSLEELKEKTKGNYDNAGQREGIVIRPKGNVIFKQQPLSMKVINEKYLLKEK